MEVTSVVHQFAILVFLFVTNVWAQNQFQAQFGQNEAFMPLGRIERSQSRPSAVAGIPQGGAVLSNLAPANAYAEQPSYSHFSLPSLRDAVFFGQHRPEFPLLRSLVGAVKNTLLVGLNLLQLSDTDRHVSLRRAADNLNAVVDNTQNFVHQITRYVENVYNHLSQVPLLGLFVRVAGKLLLVTAYLPRQILAAITSFVKKMVDERQQTSNYAADLSYAYA